MSYITDIPSDGIWFDTTEGWYLYGTSDFYVQTALKGDGFDHVDNGPFQLNLFDVDTAIGSEYVDVGRTFVCDSDLLYHFNFCHMEMEDGDQFQLFGSMYTEDQTFPPLNEMDIQYDTGDSISNLGEALGEDDQLNTWRKDQYLSGYTYTPDYTWRCKSVADLMVSSTDHIGYHIAMRMNMNYVTDTFAIRDFEASCISNTVHYNIFALSDPSDSIVFGFQTGPDNTPKALKATVIIDFYGDEGSDILRCQHFGVKPSTSYMCYSRGDNVFAIPSNYNTDNLEHKIIIRAFEHAGMDIAAAFIGSAELLAESVSNAALVSLSQEVQHFSSNTLWAKFALTLSESNTETTIQFENSQEDPYNFNVIDNNYGTIKTESDNQVSVNFEWNYDSDAGDCMWNEEVSESIYAVKEPFGYWDILGTVGSVAAVFGGPMAVVGNVAMATANMANLFSDGSSVAELTQDALLSLQSGTEDMIACNQQLAADKMNALKEAVDTALQELEENVDAKVIQLLYKIHIENVEQELAGLQDTVNVLNRQWGYIKTMTDNGEIMGELKNILMNTMPRLGTIIKTKPIDADFDYFWRLYSKEMSLFLPEILVLRFDIWELWLFYNDIDLDESDKSIKDIVPDFRRVFRDLTGELIAEYIHLLPMAILTIMKQEHGSNELQPMTITERFREITLRFKPGLICGWMQMAQILTESDDTDFLGDYGYLYDDNLDECASTVRKHIINEVVRIDNSRHHDDEIVFGNEFESLVYDLCQYDFFVASPDGFGCSFDWPESDDCRMTMSADLQSDNFGINSFEIDVEGFLNLRIAPLLLIEESEYVAPAILEISNSETLDEFDLNIYPNSDGFPQTTAMVSCSDGYRMSGIRFGTVSFGEKDEDAVSDSEEVNINKFDDEIGWLYFEVDDYPRFELQTINGEYIFDDIPLRTQSPDPSDTFDTYETIAVKLLCRPIPQSEQELYDTFTDYEIVTKIPDDNVEEKEVSWDEWMSCPIGTFIQRMWLHWDQDTGSVHLGYVETGYDGLSYHRDWKSYDEERPISWNSKMQIWCYDGDHTHTYHSLLNEANTAIPPDVVDIYSFKLDHLWILVLLLLVLVPVQWMFCFYRRKRTTKSIEHFNQETSDDENMP